MPSQVYELAGQLEATDPLAEEILAVLFSDQPVRVELRPTDNRRHWQWFARDPVGSTSRVWVDFGQPIVDDTVELLANRAESALQVLVPQFATEITATASQTAINEIRLVVDVTRANGTTTNLDLTVTGGA